MNDNDKKTVERILYYCNRLQEHILFFGNSKDEYITNNQYQDACSMVIIKLGEQVGRLSDEFKNENDDIDWNGIKCMRNVHAHDYDNIMFDVTWESITEEVPYLKEYLEQLIY